MLGAKKKLERIMLILKEEYNAYIKASYINKYSFSIVEFNIIINETEIFLTNHSGTYELKELWCDEKYYFDDVSKYLNDYDSRYALNMIENYFVIIPDNLKTVYYGKGL